MVNKILNRLGFTLSNLKEQSKFPYLKNYDTCNQKFKVWIPDEVAKRWYDVDFENNIEELKVLNSMIQSEDKVLELGVHYGFYASFISNHLKNGSYLGVELQPKSAMYAHSNMSLNCYNNSRIINAAAGNEKGTISYQPFQNGNANVSKNSETDYKIDVVSADDLDQEFGNFTFLKIDVEGFELEVLKGAKKLLMKKPKIAIEVHNPFLKEQEIIEIYDLIATENYEGKMFIRPNYNMEKFDKEKAISSKDIVNIFLTPK